MPQRTDPAPTAPMPPRAPRGQGRFLPGTVLAARYRVVALAGQGGMGEVYRADDLKIGQPVALKFLPADLEGDPDRLQRLLGEVRVARQVSHPNVCRVHDVVELEGRHFITMEYVDGEDLASLLRRIGRVPPEKALDLTRQIASGLAAAHAQGIIHRDLKPANIMLDGRGRARITDFGLAAVAERVRGGEAAWGTPAYMAPEQREGGEVTARTDVYALGLVLYEMFTGRRAVAEPTPAGASSPVETASPSSHIPGLDSKIDSTILRCIERDPARRPASAVDVLASLPAGDALEAALRAGETPSPELVAASGEEGSLSPGRAWGLLGLALLAASAAIVLCVRTSGIDAVPMTRSPEVLKERAQEIVRGLGGDASPRFVDWWFRLDDGYADWVLHQPRGPSLARARPPAFRFGYRQSPVVIAPTRAFRPTKDDPARVWSGESFVSLDLQGALLEFSRLDRQLAAADSTPAAAVDWTPLLSFAGVRPGDLRSTAPLWTPDVPCDERAAWIADTGGTPVRLEAAAWKGMPVWFRTIAPWNRAERDSPTAPRGTSGFSVFVVLVVVIIIGFGSLARRNLRLGRGDRRGALRVAAAVFVSFSLADLLVLRWSFEPALIWRSILHLSYFPALAAWLTYLGIEPFLRRRWPHRLVAWNRLLEGRIGDPLVGRETLLGLLAGVGAVLAGSVPAVLERRQDVDLLLMTIPLGRAADFWAGIADTVGEALMRGTGSFAILLLLRFVLRRDALAWVGLGLIWTLTALPAWNISAIEWIGLVGAGTCLVLAARVGLVASIVATGTVVLITWCAPLTLDASRWYAWRTGVIAVLLIAIAVWGFRATMGRRRIFSAAMLDA